MELGYIAIHRKLREHWLYKEDRQFSKFEAWIDILYEVNHQDNKFLHGNELIEVKRGSKITSLRKLSERWKWSITKVNDFLILLEKDEMIEVKKDTKKTVITVVNYNLYQSDEWKKRHEKDTEKTVEEHEKDTKKTRKETNKNDKNDEERKELKNIYFDNEELNKTFLDFIDMRKKIKFPLTENGIKLVINELRKLSDDEEEQKKILEQSIMNNYRGIFALKNKANDNSVITELKQSYNDDTTLNEMKGNKINESNLIICESVYETYLKNFSKKGNKKKSFDYIERIILKKKYEITDFQRILKNYFLEHAKEYPSESDFLKYAKEPQNFFSESNGYWEQFDVKE